MSRDKQIEEMAEILVDGCKMGGCEECKHSEDVFPKCTLKYTADQLYNAGYRKASEVAREIFEEIEKNMVAIDDIDFNHFRAIGRRTFAELKKKYTEREKDNG